MFAAALIIVGAIFLLKNLGVISGVQWEIIWPIVLIVLGVSMLFKKKM